MVRQGNQTYRRNASVPPCHLLWYGSWVSCLREIDPVRPRRRRRLGLAAMAVAAAFAGAALQPTLGQSLRGSDETFVVFGPQGDIIDQVRYLRKTWRHDNAITVVEVEGWPNCERADNDARTYCSVRVRHKTFVSIDWLSGGAEDSFILLYWYKSEESPMKLADGDRVLVFLAPTMQPVRQGRRTYSATLMMPPTPENIETVRRAVYETIR